MDKSLDEIIAKWLDGLEWGNEEPEQMKLFKEDGEPPSPPSN